MKLYAIVQSVGAYAKEDPAHASIAGIFTDEEIAKKVKLCVPGSEIKEIELDKIQPGYYTTALELYNVDLKELQKRKSYGLRTHDELDKECLMTAEDFEADSNSGFLTGDDGSGYWATSTEVSNISSFAERPSWATHVCWYNK